MSAMTLRYAYNTNGLTSHRLDDALALLADCGYDGVALTLDVAPPRPVRRRRPPGPTRRCGAACDGLGLGGVVETGARFLLDPRGKHEPTLVNADAGGPGPPAGVPAARASTSRPSAAAARPCRSGPACRSPASTGTTAWQLARRRRRAVVDTPRRRGRTPCAVEPEPGMLVEDCDDWAAPRRRRAGPHPGAGHRALRRSAGGTTPHEAVRAFAPRLGTVAVEDMRRGVHEHLPLGEGDIDLPAVLGALRDVGYDRLVCLELSRDGHRAHQLVPARSPSSCAGRPA